MIKYLFFLFAFTFQLNAQENDSIQKEKSVNFEETFRLYYIIPNQIGNHTLAQDYKNRFGFGARLTLVSIKNFNLGFGGEYVSYKVTNKSNAGNFTYGNYKNAFLLVDYPINISKTITLNPTSSIGLLQFTQREKNVRHSHQNGINYSFGFTTDYEIGKEIDLFFGLDYIYTKYKLEANSEILDYYGKSNAIQFTFGIKLKTVKNP